MKTLAELRRLGRKKPADDQKFLEAALQFAVETTRSEIGLVSIVVHDEVHNATRLRAEAAYVQGAATETPRYRLGILWEIGGAELPRGLRSLSGFVAHTRRPVCCPDVTQQECYLAVDHAVCSELDVPIMQAGSLIGVHAGVPLAALHEQRGIRELRVAAAMVEVKMRVDQ